MLSLSCKDMGIDCDFVVTGNSIDEIKMKAREHLKAEHANLIETDWTPAQMIDLDRMLEGKIKFS